MKFWNIQIGQLDPHFQCNYIYFGKICQLLVVDMIYLNSRKNIFPFTTKFQWWWYIKTHVRDWPWIPLEVSSFRKTISKLESNFSPHACLCLRTSFELWGEGFVTFFIPYSFLFCLVIKIINMKLDDNIVSFFIKTSHLHEHLIYRHRNELTIVWRKISIHNFNCRLWKIMFHVILFAPKLIFIC